MEPLTEVLKGLKAWITGIRREQSPTRAGAQVVEWDRKFGLVKINPLVAWKDRDVWKYILENNVPYNPLHDRAIPPSAARTAPGRCGRARTRGRAAGRALPRPNAGCISRGGAEVAALIPPHGGRLVDRWLRGPAREEALERAGRMRRVRLDAREAADLEMIGDGALSPLTGFMGEADYRSVLAEMRLAGGLLWALPVTLAVSRDEAEAIREGDEIALEDPAGRLLALMQVSERFLYDREEEALRCYGTADDRHPGVQRLRRQGGVYLGGDVWLVERPPARFPEYQLSPAETRAAIARRGWRTVVGFQTRNPVHRAHEYIQKCALEICDGLLLHPLVGETKADDMPAGRAHAGLRGRPARELLPGSATLLGGLPGRHALRRAPRGGLARHLPQELRLHALHRRTGPRRRRQLLRHLRRAAHLRARSTRPSWASRRSSSSTPSTAGRAAPWPRPRPARTAPTSGVSLSRHPRCGRCCAAGEAPPPEFTRPEVARVLMEGVRVRARGPSVET